MRKYIGFLFVLFTYVLTWAVGNLKGNEFRPLIILIVLLVVTAIFICFKTRGSLHDDGKPILTNTSTNKKYAIANSQLFEK